MKRFVLFMGYNYYPSGGFGDYCGDFDCWQSCILHKATIEDQSWKEGYWWQVVDTVTMKLINNHEPHNWEVIEPQTFNN